MSSSNIHALLAKEIHRLFIAPGATIVGTQSEQVGSITELISDHLEAQEVLYPTEACNLCPVKAASHTVAFKDRELFFCCDCLDTVLSKLLQNITASDLFEQIPTLLQ